MPSSYSTNKKLPFDKDVFASVTASTLALAKNTSTLTMYPGFSTNPGLQYNSLNIADTKWSLLIDKQKAITTIKKLDCNPLIEAINNLKEQQNEAKKDRDNINYAALKANQPLLDQLQNELFDYRTVVSGTRSMLSEATDAHNYCLVNAMFVEAELWDGYRKAAIMLFADVGLKGNPKIVIVDMVEEESAIGESLETELIDGDDDVATVEGTGQVDNDPNRSGFARKRSTKERVDDVARKRGKKTVQTSNLITRKAFESGLKKKRTYKKSSLPNLHNQSLLFIPKDDTNFFIGTVNCNAYHTNVDWSKISRHVLGQSHIKHLVTWNTSKIQTSRLTSCSVERIFSQLQFIRRSCGPRMLESTLELRTLLRCQHGKGDDFEM